MLIFQGTVCHTNLLWSCWRCLQRQQGRERQERETLNKWHEHTISTALIIISGTHRTIVVLWEKRKECYRCDSLKFWYITAGYITSKFNKRLNENITIIARSNVIPGNLVTPFFLAIAIVCTCFKTKFYYLLFSSLFYSFTLFYSFLHFYSFLLLRKEIKSLAQKSKLQEVTKIIKSWADIAFESHQNLL